MKLYFKTPNNRRLLGEYSSAIECCDAIHAFLVDHNYRSYWWTVSEGTEITIDVGSYTEFFKVEGAKFKEFCKASAKHYEESHLKPISIHSWNYPSFLSVDEIYYIYERNITEQQAEQLRKHNINYLEETTELIGVKRGTIPYLEKTAENGYHEETRIRLRDIAVDFFWIKIDGKELYQRLYKISAKAEYLDYTGEWAAYNCGYGNQVFEWKDNRFFSFVYHICRETSEDFSRCLEMIEFTSKEKCMEDMTSFRIEEWHYRECIEDLLGCM